MKVLPIYNSFLALILSLPLFAGAQLSVKDSLYAVLKTRKEDTAKANTLIRLGLVLFHKGELHKADSVSRVALQLFEKFNSKSGIADAYTNLCNILHDEGEFKSATDFGEKALKLSIEIGYRVGIADAAMSLGNLKRDQSNYPEALKYYLLALKTDSATGSKMHTGADLSNIGTLYFEQGNYPEALNYQLLALKTQEDMGNKHGILLAYGNLGNIYYAQSNNKDALDSYTKCLKIAEELGDKLGMAEALSSLGNIYNDADNYSEALKYQLKSLELDKELGDKNSIAIDYTMLCSIYQYLGRYDESLQSGLKAIELSKETGDKRVTSTAYGNLGGLFIKKKNYPVSKKYLDSATVLAKTIRQRDALRDLYSSWSELDSNMGNYKNAFEDYKIFISYRDSLKNEEDTKKLVSEQMQFEFDKKQAQQKALQDEKDAIAAADKKRQNIITASVSFGLLLVLAFSGLLFSRFRVTQRQKKIIEEQKQVVEEKNKEVLDSITYAKRLQDAILPPISAVKKYIPDSFVLYKPKDIVAGDFYWMEKIDDTVLMAAADCTGHGVPGAMVSVVCSNALNRAVKEFRITEPGKILDKVRELVLETFEKSESEVKDGMDISLASLTLSKEELKIRWAGAFNPLWYVENGEFREIKGDKQPIGKTDNPKPFTTHTFTVSPRLGATLYLFTDGYADQFGGEKGKKFKYKQLQEKLVSLASKDMNIQRETLDTILESWKGNLEQTDDICIIGIRT